MKKTKVLRIIIVLIIALIGKLMMAQEKTAFAIETQGGYEFNYFKSPKAIRYEGNLLTESDLISSSSYEHVAINFRYSNKWNKKSRLRFLLNPFTRLFNENMADSYWGARTHLKYDYNFTKNFALESEVRFKRMDREGLGGDQDVLINPLGYTNYGGTIGIKLKPLRLNLTVLEGFYNFKDFDRYGVRDLQFDEFGVQFSSVQSLKVGKLRHKIGFSAYAKKRLYDTFNASVIDNEGGERDWDYLRGLVFYEIPFSKQFKIKPTYIYYQRIDNSARRSEFTQFGPGTIMSFRSDRTKIRSSFSFITRNYKQIEARNTEERIGEKLNYEYVNFQLSASQKISKGLSISASLYSRVRSTNYTDIDARSFRNYRNQYGGLGLLWEL